jgi:hypothetical protein
MELELSVKDMSRLKIAIFIFKKNFLCYKGKEVIVMPEAMETNLIGKEEAFARIEKARKNGQSESA